MRESAERSRGASLVAARADAARLVEEARHRATAQAEALERRAEEGAAAIETRREAEMARLRAEADQRLAEHEEIHQREAAAQRESTQRQILAIQAQLAEFEAVLGRFFGELALISDPAMFVAAATRMPVAPELGRSDEPGQLPDASPGTTPDGLVSTTIAVAGHDSFGAVTSVKQALERVPGIASVRLGVGEAGEFTLTTEHPAGFDLRGALTGLGLRGAQIEGEADALRLALGPIP